MWAWLIPTIDAYLFAVAGGGVDVVEVRRGVLGADLHGFGVAERGGVAMVPLLDLTHISETRHGRQAVDSQTSRKRL